MQLEEFRALLSTTGQQALAEASEMQPVEADFLRDFSALSRRFPRALARAALETAILRREARSKFEQAEQMYFTRPALEQASSQAVARHRAQRFAGLAGVADLGCSIGGDTLALAERTTVVGVERDPLRLGMAQANLAACGLGEQAAFIQADLAEGLPLKATSDLGLFFDPARRAGGRRIYSVEQYQPPLSAIQAWTQHFPALGVKISPGVKLEELAGYAAEIEFISLQGELKEAVLWFGPLRSAWRRATLLPGGESMLRQEPGEDPPARLSEPLAVLYEPDPAILRAGLVRPLGQELGAAQLDQEIAYLTAADYTPTPFARAWVVEAWFPFQLKRLRQELRARGVGQVVVKKRGSALEPEQLQRQLRLSGDASRTIFLTQLRGEPVVVLATGEIRAGAPGR